MTSMQKVSMASNYATMLYQGNEIECTAIYAAIYMLYAIFNICNYNASCNVSNETFLDTSDSMHAKFSYSLNHLMTQHFA